MSQLYRYVDVLSWFADLPEGHDYPYLVYCSNPIVNRIESGPGPWYVDTRGDITLINATSYVRYTLMPGTDIAIRQMPEPTTAEIERARQRGAPWLQGHTLGGLSLHDYYSAEQAATIREAELARAVDFSNSQQGKPYTFGYSDRLGGVAVDALDAVAAADNVNNPAHYQSESGLEAIVVIEAFFRDNYHRAAAFKYLARAGKKDPAKELEDLRKARWYVDREIAELESRKESPHQPG